ncbi:MAG: hypothetical protein WAK27_03155 [Candidatus Sulfotelmatobacter sp.]
MVFPSKLCAFIFLIVVSRIPFACAQQSAPPPGSSSSVQHPRKTAPDANLHLDLGTVSNGTYRNPSFGFTCKVPEGWVLRTEDMNEGDDEQLGPEAGKSGHVLLAAFSRPPAARGEDVNSSILIAAESTAEYPGLKEAAQYFGPLTEIAKAQGFVVAEEPYEFAIGAKTVVRGDFQKDVGSRVMRQSTLVMLARGYAVSFTFIGGTEDEVEELIAGLSFAVAAKPHQR